MPNPGQIKKLHTLLSLRNMMSEKRRLISEITKGRTNSSKAMKAKEINELINHLAGNRHSKPGDAADRMRKKIISMAHQMNWYVKDDTGLPIINKKGKEVIDMERIDNWCVKYGPYHKALNDHSAKELTTLITVFEKVLKHFLQTSY